MSEPGNAPSSEIMSFVRAHLTSDDVASQWPLSTNKIDVGDVASAIEVLLSGRYTMGPRTRAFEQAWNNWLGTTGSVMVNSGSSANLAAMSALMLADDRPLQPGDEVIVPAVTWSTALFPIAQVGCTPVLADVDPSTLNLTLEHIEAAMSERTRALFVVHTLGNPCPMHDIMRFARKHGLWVVEDCCEAHGARIHDQLVGTWGDLSTFSFFFSHHMTTIEGGMACAPTDGRFTNLLRSIRAHGWVRERDDRAELSAELGCSDDTWLFVAPGYNLRPTDINAAIGLRQLERIPHTIQRHQAVHAKMRAGLVDLEGILAFQEAVSEGEPSPFGFAILVMPGGALTRDRLREQLDASGIETRPVIGGNLARQPAMAHVHARIPTALSNADLIHDHGLMIGINPDCNDAQIDHVISTLAACCSMGTCAAS
jgi:CDP-6-deoxy-D-xylo-4-hexulose-3-dehydrase